MRRRSERAAISSNDAAAFGAAARRTRIIRAALAVAAVALLVAGIATARGAGGGGSDALPRGSGIVVIDLSLSIGPRDYRDIRAVLRRLIADGAPQGLVSFSDVPYEMLPPGTPARELRPLLRLLVPRRATRDDPGLPRNPWSGAFSAGTRISAALQLARQMFVRDGVHHGSILLLSDLVTAPEDVPELARTLQQLARESISVHVVPLTPLRDGRTIFEGLLGKDAMIAPARIAGSAPLPAGQSAAFPFWLAGCGLLLLVVLALHERLAGALALPRIAGDRA